MKPSPIDAILRIYAEIDEKTAAFQSATGLFCPPGCGECCLSTRVETTLAEMLPLAAELHRRKEAAYWHEVTIAASGPRPCRLYQPHPNDPTKGRCRFYSLRPTVCRLFGFATVTKKDGRREIATCGRLKDVMPIQVAGAQGMITRGLPAPGLTEFSIRIVGLAPSLCLQLMPINRAVRLALDREGLRRRLDVEERKSRILSPEPPHWPRKAA